MPELATRRGHVIVSSSGDTLLGADDKAGVAEIVTAVAHLAAHPELPRPALRICFTPDEEIGEGATLFDIERFGALLRVHDGRLRARRARRRDVLGRRGDRHGHGRRRPSRPGDRQARLGAAGRVGDRRRAAVGPAHARHHIGPRGLHPSVRADRLGRARRDPADRPRLRRGSCCTSTRSCCATPPSGSWPAHPGATLEFDVREQYRNMRTYLAAVPEVIAAAERAIREEGIEPVRIPIRGGTDGSRLSEMGSADAEHLHRRPRVPLGPRMGVAAGDGGRGRDDRPSRRGLGARRGRRCRVGRLPRPVRRDERLRPELAGLAGRRDHARVRGRDPGHRRGPDPWRRRVRGDPGLRRRPVRVRRPSRPPGADRHQHPAADRSGGGAGRLAPAAGARRAPARTPSCCGS